MAIVATFAHATAPFERESSARFQQTIVKSKGGANVELALISRRFFSKLFFSNFFETSKNAHIIFKIIKTFTPTLKNSKKNKREMFNFLFAQTYTYFKKF